MGNQSAQMWLLAGLLGGIAVITFGLWGIFKKAGRAPWLSCIPFYNILVLCQLAGVSRWWALLIWVPVLNVLFFMALCCQLATAFGKKHGYALGLFLMGVVFFPLLAFRRTQYVGPKPVSILGILGVLVSSALIAIPLLNLSYMQAMKLAKVESKRTATRTISSVYEQSPKQPHVKLARFDQSAARECGSHSDNASPRSSTPVRVTGKLIALEKADLSQVDLRIQERMVCTNRNYFSNLAHRKVHVDRNGIFTKEIPASGSYVIYTNQDRSVDQGYLPIAQPVVISASQSNVELAPIVLKKR